MRRTLHAPRRRFVVLAAFLVFAALLLTFSDRSDPRFPHSLPFGFGTDIPDRPNLEFAQACAPEVDHLRRRSYGLTREVLYQRRCIRPSLNRLSARPNLTTVNEPLLGQAQVLSLDKTCDGWRKTDCVPVTLDLPPAFPQRDYSHLLFGVATSLDRLVDAMPQFESWLADSGARLLAIITENVRASKMDAVAARYRARGIELVVARPWNPNEPANEQHFTIVRDLLKHATAHTKWISIIDDDTFFPSLYRLDEVLNQQNYTDPVYLGGLSENHDAVQFHGFMAFGGAGAFLSVTLARELDPHLEECLAKDHVPQGDGLLKACINEKTSTKLTVVDGLHQLDMGSDLSGFYEAGRNPLSLHHWKSWHQAPVDQMVKISEFCGSCLLQRFQFGTDTVLSTGYSIAKYKGGMSGIDLGRVEGTWDGAPGFEWSLGPMREKVPSQRKKSYRLVESEKVGNNLRQVYIHRLEDDLPAPAADGSLTIDPQQKLSEMRDEVVELWWEF